MVCQLEGKDGSTYSGRINDSFLFPPRKRRKGNGVCVCTVFLDPASGQLYVFIITIGQALKDSQQSPICSPQSQLTICVADDKFFMVASTANTLNEEQPSIKSQKYQGDIQFACM